MERDVITGMVEDYWRALLPGMQTGDANVALEISHRFEQRVAGTAKLLPPVQAAAFEQAVEAEREKLMAEYTADPVALKRRLNIALGVDDPGSRSPARRNSSLGEVAIRTAVRATVWESIWAIFRSVR